MKNLVGVSVAIALNLSCATLASANEDPVLKSQMDSLQKWGASCMQAKGLNVEAACKSSLDNTLALQPNINSLDHLMMSFMVEAHARSNLANAYIKEERVGEHCDMSEKVLLTGLYASKNSDHQFFPPIKQIADQHVSDVKSCRKIFGTQPGTVKLEP